MNANGQGVGAITALRVDASGNQTSVAVGSYNANSKQYTATPISLGAADQVYLSLYGTGIRGMSSLAGVSATDRRRQRSRCKPRRRNRSSRDWTK